MAFSASVGWAALGGGMPESSASEMRSLAAVMPAAVSKRMPRVWRAGPWHWKQYVLKNGFTCESKSIFASATADSLVAGFAATPAGVASGTLAAKVGDEAIGVGAVCAGVATAAGGVVAVVELEEVVEQAPRARAMDPIKNEEAAEEIFIRV